MIQRFGTQMPLVARINVTPIIDVALVLVIILLITAPMLAVTDKSLQLPTASTQRGAEGDRVLVTLGRSGDLGIDDTTVAAPRFVDELRRRLESHGDGALVVVRADATAHHAAVRALLESVREAGARRLAVATRPEGSR